MKRKASRRELMEPHKGDKHYIRRDERGRIEESDNVGRSLTQDRRAKTIAKAGQGDKGDRPATKRKPTRSRAAR
jgi:hypothetical protein